MKLSIADISNVDAKIFRFYRGHVTSSGQGFALFPEHNVTFWRVHRGSVTVVTGDGSPLIAQQDDLFFCLPAVSRYQTFSDNAEITSIWLNVDWGTLKHYKLDGLPKVLAADDCPRLTAACECVEKILVRYGINTIGPLDRNMLSLRDGLMFRSLGQDIFSSMIGYLVDGGVEFTTKESTDARIATAVRYLESGASSGAVAYGQITEATGLSRVHIDRLFREHLNMTPKQFLEKQCFEKAAELLTRSGKPVYLIADELDFRSTAHFCSWFKRQCTLTPKQFRKRQVI